MSTLPADDFTLGELTAVYNAGRSDYLVPMPMTEVTLARYAHLYDVDFASSVVLVCDEQPVGIGMLGLRDQRAWLTRLGVVPHQRQHGAGRLIVAGLLANARARGATLAQLEMIEGNEPARHLFEGAGFRERRRLLILRRAAGPAPASTAALCPLDAEQIAACLAARAPGASWIDETQSLINGGDVEGWHLDGHPERWLVLRRHDQMLSHLVLAPAADAEVASDLLASVHHQYADHAAEVENLPPESALRPAFEAAGYQIAFRRIEMTQPL
jgi:ribosomal protein S18 acetylase RimI-like enzyme